MKKRLFDIGKMRQRVSLYTVTRTDDGAGGFTREDPAPGNLIGTYWGNIDPISARERQWGIQFTEVTTHVCWLRYNTNVYETGLVICDGVTYYVESAFDPDRLKEFIMMTLREGGPT